MVSSTNTEELMFLNCGAVDNSGQQEIKPVESNRNQLQAFTGRTDVEAEAPGLPPPDARSQLIGIDPDTGKD